MDTQLLRIPVRRQRDALLARRQVRPVARLLGFDAAEQACIAGLVFELAAQALTQAARVCLADLSQMDGPWSFAATPIAEVAMTAPWVPLMDYL